MKQDLRWKIEYEIRQVVDGLSGTLGMTLGEAVRKKNEIIRKGADKIHELVKD